MTFVQCPSLYDAQVRSHDPLGWTAPILFADMWTKTIANPDNAAGQHEIDCKNSVPICLWGLCLTIVTSMVFLIMVLPLVLIVRPFAMNRRECGYVVLIVYAYAE
jgi:hypothetical protein